MPLPTIGYGLLPFVLLLLVSSLSFHFSSFHHERVRKAVRQAV